MPLAHISTCQPSALKISMRKSALREGRTTRSWSAPMPKWRSHRRAASGSIGQRGADAVEHDEVVAGAVHLRELELPRHRDTPGSVSGTLGVASAGARARCGDP